MSRLLSNYLSVDKFSEAVFRTFSEYIPVTNYINYGSYDRKIYGSEYKNKNIAIFGCSFTYGAGLKPEQTFAAKLSNLTKNTIYNFSLIGGSPKNMLWLFRDRKILDKILNNENIDYVIYIYINEHKHRLELEPQMNPSLIKFYIDGDDIKYKKKLIAFEPKFIREYKLFRVHQKERNSFLCETLNLYFLSIQREMKDYFKNQKHQPKFIILKYPDDPDNDYLDDLEKYGIEVIDIRDITDVDLHQLKYQISENDKHPNEQAWDIIVPALVKKLKF